MIIMIFMENLREHNTISQIWGKKGQGELEFDSVKLKWYPSLFGMRLNSDKTNKE